MFYLPQELVSYIYTFDSTYTEKFTKFVLIHIEIASYKMASKTVIKNGKPYDFATLTCQKRLDYILGMF
jgi:hypothetical protein